MDRQRYWNSAFKSAQSKGYSASDSKRIANISASNYKEPTQGKRSLAVNAGFTESDNILDILVGYPDSGIEKNVVDSLDNSGWESFKSLQTKADLEHFNLDFSQGVANNLDEKWQHFGVETELYKSGNEIRAKVTVPDSELGQEFRQDYKAGKYGASIEYGGYNDGNKITNWEITGLSFTETPHYEATKPKTI